MKKLFLLILLSIVFLGGCAGNVAPTLASISNQSTNEATAKFVTLVGADANIGDILTYSATSSNSDVVITVSGHTLTLTPNSDWNGSATITAKVNDGAVDSALQTFTLTVNVFVSGGSFKGKVYGTVTSPDTGRVWLDRNLGATQVCTSSTDSSCYGHLYQWGRNDDGHELRTSSVTTTRASSLTPAITTFITNSVLPNDWTTADSNGSLRTAALANAGVNDICPAGFSVPTEAELKADTIDATTTDITNAATAFSSFLKLPLSGYRDNNRATLMNLQTGGIIASLTYTGGRFRAVSWIASAASAGNGWNNSAHSIRCIKDF
jgi:uncharacterized protein (TIGR02145 family)